MVCQVRAVGVSYALCGIAGKGGTAVHTLEIIHV